MASSEFPLRTNYELTRILSIYNGSNEIEIIRNFPKNRIAYSWRKNETENKMIKTTIRKSNPPHNFTIVKGYAYCVLHRNFVEYAVRDSKARDLLKWGEDTFSPDEW